MEEPWNGPAVRVQPGQKTAGLCPVRVTNPPRPRGSGFWPGNEPNRTEPPVKTRTGGGLPGPVANTNHGLQMHLSVHSIPASNCIDQTSSITASKYIIRQRHWVYGDSGVTVVEWATWSIYSGNPGVHRQPLIFILSCHTTIIHTLSFPTFGLTCSFRDFMNHHGGVVSNLLIFFPHPSNVMLKERKERFLQHYPLHCYPDASVYPMNPFRCMVTVGHNARVFV